MLFKEALSKTSIEDIIKYFQNDENEAKWEKEYRKLYEELMNKTSEFSEYSLIVVQQKEYFDEEERLSVFGFKKDSTQHYAMDFMPRTKWLGCECGKKSISTYGLTCFVAECLKEMTLISFDERVVESELEILEGRMREVEAGNVKYIPAEEVFKRLHEELGMEEYIPPVKTPEEEEIEHQRIFKLVEFNNNKILEMIKED